MLVVFPASIRHDEGLVPSYYEDHLLERVTLLEIRLSQVAERLSTALDLMLRQSKSLQSSQLLLENLIDSLNLIGALEKDSLDKKWQKSVADEELKETFEAKKRRLIKKIIARYTGDNKDLFKHHLKEGFRFLAQDQEKQSFQTFERALHLCPENTPLLLFMAEIQFQAEKSARAKEYLEKAFSISPHDEKVLFLLGIVLADLVETEKAKDCFKKLPKRAATKFCVNYVLGFIAVFEDDWKAALVAFKETLSAFEAPETHYLMGCLYFQLGKHKTALGYLQKAVEIDTNFADAWFMLAVIYQILGDQTKSNQAVELTWSSKETGADCLKFMKRGLQIEIQTALPFFRLKDLKKNLIMSSSIRFSKLFRREVSKILDS